MSNKSYNHSYDFSRLQWVSRSSVSGPQALVLILVGLVLVISPGTILTTLLKIIGAAAMVYGAYLIFSWYSTRTTESRSMAAAGTAAVLAGLFVFLFPRALINIFPIAAGIVILINGLVHLAEAMELRKSASAHWILAAVFSAITVFLGLFLILHPFSAMSTLVRVLGCVMIYNGLTGFFISRQLQ